MPKIPLNGGSYQTRVGNQNAQRTINWYPVEDTTNGNDSLILMPTPGYGSAFVTLGAGTSPIRGMIAASTGGAEVLAAVSGDKFYTITAGGTATERGTLSNSSGRVKMYRNMSSKIMILDGAKGWSYSPDTTFAEITDADFIDAATQGAAMDGYLFTISPGSGQVNISDLDSSTSWNALQYNTALTEPDDGVALASISPYLYVIGLWSTEIWYNSGAFVPFEKNPSVFINWGCAAANSVVNLGDSLMWLGQSKIGGLDVIQCSGSQVQSVSNRGILQKINSLTTKTDAYAVGYNMDGHTFYNLTFPTENITYSYDATTGLWHERQSLDTTQKEWLAFDYTYFNGNHYIGSSIAGKIYQLSNTTYQEDGSAITRTRISPPLTAADNSIITQYRLEIEFEVGVSSGSAVEVTLEVSTNGGQTYNTALTRTISSAAGDNVRVVWNRLGSGRNITYKLTTTANARVVVLGAHLEASAEVS